ncbi:hypothetical protein GCM10010289_43090 [Streptomyces violascens]|uniref:Uncharacterized protein n=1 Tax=Streptomyces violascens TaxID=67381 RepID=A0ABQ3QP94_9ACTN|nr:hypothetical protein [Streptomyces violascens]GGU16771.1 hypothetical protein GCM10010289_43090 [Streptomyces violascens]GHI39096.1 hypothetical protein Sviol_35040 [Streptomyces violascens]
MDPLDLAARPEDPLDLGIHRDRGATPPGGPRRSRVPPDRQLHRGLPELPCQPRQRPPPHLGGMQPPGHDPGRRTDQHPRDGASIPPDPTAAHCPVSLAHCTGVTAVLLPAPLAYCT